RQVAASSAAARRTPAGWLCLAGVDHHNLHDVAVEFPVGVLCVVTGVSGSGKSSLVEETLYPAVVAGLQSRSGTHDGKYPLRRPPHRHPLLFSRATSADLLR